MRCQGTEPHLARCPTQVAPPAPRQHACPRGMHAIVSCLPGPAFQKGTGKGRSKTSPGKVSPNMAPRPILLMGGSRSQAAPGHPVCARVHGAGRWPCPGAADRLLPMPRSSLCGCEQAPTPARAGWRCCATGSGAPCVTSSGTWPQPAWCAGNWATGRRSRPWWERRWAKVRHMAWQGLVASLGLEGNDGESPDLLGAAGASWHVQAAPACTRWGSPGCFCHRQPCARREPPQTRRRRVGAPPCSRTGTERGALTLPLLQVWDPST